MEAYRENLGMEWRYYQNEYKQKLKNIATTQKEKDLAEQIEVKMQQIVLPELNRIDRCVSCHIGIEDPRMKDEPQPLRTHPGKFLEIHEIEKMGCTICHDGQGRAITSMDAHAQGAGKHWEKPLLKKPVVEANCYRCHHSSLKETPNYNQGKEIFETKGCLGCHQINKMGGAKGTDLSNIGNANFQMKSPISKHRDQLLDKFDGNVNLAYIYESVKDPLAQPEDSVMFDYEFSEAEAVKLTVFLKGLTTDEIPKSLLYKKPPDILPTPLERGASLYGMYCAGCHGENGEGGVMNLNAQTGEEIPGLKYVAEGYTIDELRKQITEGVPVIEKLNPDGPVPPLGMPAWKNNFSNEELEDLIVYLLSLMPEEEEDW